MHAATERERELRSPTHISRNIRQIYQIHTSVPVIVCYELPIDLSERQLNVKQLDQQHCYTECFRPVLLTVPALGRCQYISDAEC